MYPSTRRNYTDEFKTQAVALAESVGRTEAARQLEMSVKTLSYVILAKLDAPTAEAAARAITREMSRMAPALLKTMTHDQGSEMARHAEITAHTGMKI